MDSLILADLVTDLPDAVRLQRLAHVLQQRFHSDAVGLLKLDEGSLRLVGAAGLADDALGRRFKVAEHPRFATILSRREPTWFEPGSPLPDPYDGLLDDRRGAPLPVHDCLGMSLYVQGKLWGALTLDALKTGSFDDDTRMEVQRYALLLETAIRVTLLEKENRHLRQLGAGGGQNMQYLDETEIIGRSEAMAQLLHELDVVADSDLPVLLLGETGVGKELFARRVHRKSRRRHKPMVHVNCAALPESLAESELFGHVKGAFSGATQDRMGRFEAAQGGTLFLDEVGELPLSVQAKLLRALQNGEIQRLGTDTSIKTDVRIIAATNRELKKNTLEGSFRADLYHRLSVYPVPIPPLRERDRDVLLIAGHFLEFNRARLGIRGLRLSYAAEEALLAYPWPGNVRELEHVISRAALKLLSRGASRDQILTLPAEMLDLDLPGDRPPQGAPSASEIEPTTQNGPEQARLAVAYPQPLRTALEQFERERIRAALSATGNNWARAARLLEIDSSNLHKRARKLGLKTPTVTSSSDTTPT